MWEAPAALPGPHARWWGTQVRKLGPEGHHRSPSRRQIPRSLRACPLVPHKGQKGTWEETGPSGGAGCWDGPVSCSPRAMKQLLPQSPMEALGRCAERAGASHGERGVAPLPLVSPDLRRKETWVKLRGRQSQCTAGPAGEEVAGLADAVQDGATWGRSSGRLQSKRSPPAVGQGEGTEETGGRGPRIQETKGHSEGDIHTAHERKAGRHGDRDWRGQSKGVRQQAGRQRQLRERRRRGSRHLEKEQGGQVRAWGWAWGCRLEG